MYKKSPTFSQSTAFSNSNDSPHSSLESIEEETDEKDSFAIPEISLECSRFWEKASKPTYSQAKTVSIARNSRTTSSSSIIDNAKRSGNTISSSNGKSNSKGEKEFNSDDDNYDPEIANLYKYLLLKNVSNEVTASHIYNLFQCYGKVSAIYYKESEHYALVQFGNSRQATVCKSALSGQLFFDSQLEILILSQQHFDILSQEDGYSIYKGRQEIYNAKTKFTFVNYPSETIYISNLRDQLCKYDFLVDTFAPFGLIQAMKIEKKGNDKNSCFLKYSSIAESIIAISHMNMRDICGRKLNVCFTKTTLA